jgi:hypothetical protein
LTQWQTLLDRAVAGLNGSAAFGAPVPDWVVGGGTAIMLWLDHRSSKDIDIFLTDPQYLTYLSPRLAGETLWDGADYDEASHYLKLRYAEGEIDFIVALPITEIPAVEKRIGGNPGVPEYSVMLEHPVETAMKKLRYRGSEMKVRDAFDIAVVDYVHPELLRQSLPLAARNRQGIKDRLARMKPDFFAAELAELDIHSSWRHVAETAFARIEHIADLIPGSG